MDLGIAGRVALVTGAGGGLGGAVVEALAREGAVVAACSRTPEHLAATVARTAAAPVPATGFVLDLGDPDQVAGTAAEVAASLGPVDILVNISGGPPATTASGATPEDWHRHLELMVTSTVRLTDLVLPGMRARGWGRVLTNTSSGVVTPIPLLALSNALRAGLVGWSKTLAGEVARDGVTVNVVVPGRIHTSAVDAFNEARAAREGRTPDEVSAASTASIPARRYGRPEEYADTVAFLASERASYITGSTIRVDGGLIPAV